MNQANRRGPAAASREVTTRGREIGRRIAQARREAGLTQAEVANELSVSERSFQAHEAGKVIPYRHLRDLERILGRSAKWLLHGEEEAQSEPAEMLTEIRALRTEVRDLAAAVRSLAKHVGAAQ